MTEPEYNSKTKTKRTKRITNPWLRALVYIVLPACLLISCVLLVFSLEDNRLRLIKYVIAKVDSESLQLEIEGLRSPSLLSVEAERVVVSNRKSWSVETENAHVTVALAPLLDKSLVIKRLRAQSVELRLDSKDANKARAKMITLPGLPRISVENFDFSNIDIVSADRNLPPFAAKGLMSLDKGVYAKLSFSEIAANNSVDLVLELDRALGGKVSFNYSEPQQGRLKELLRLQTEGDLELSGNAQLKQSAQYFSFNIQETKITTENFSPRVSMRLTLDKDTGGVTIEQGKANIGGTQHTFSGKIKSPDIDFHADIKKLPFFAFTPWWPTAPEGEISGEVNFNSGRKPNPIAAKNVRVKLSSTKLPITANGNLSSNFTRVYLESFDVAIAKSRLNVTGALNLDGSKSDLVISTDELDLKILEEFALVKKLPIIEKAQQVSLRLSGNIRDPDARLNLRSSVLLDKSSHEIKAEVFKSGSIVDVTEFSVSGKILSLVASGSIDLEDKTHKLSALVSKFDQRLIQYFGERFAVEGLRYKGEAKVNTSGSVSEPIIRYTTKITGAYEADSFVTNVEGQLTPKRIDVKRFELNVNNTPAIFAKSVTRFNQPIWESGNDLNPEIEADIRLLDLPPSLLERWRLPPKSELTGDITLEGTLRNPSLTGFINLSVEHMSFAGKTDNYSWESQWQLAAKKQEIKLSFIKNKSNIGSAKLTGDILPVAFDLVGKKPSQRTLIAELEMDLDLEAFYGFLDPTLHQVRGGMKSRFTVIREKASTAYEGFVRITKGFYQHRLSEFEVRNIECNILANKATVSIEQCAGNTNSNGTLDLGGEIKILELNKDNSAVNLWAELGNVPLSREDVLDGEINGKLILAGPGQELMLSGDLELAPLNISIVTPNTSDIPSIDVEEVYSDVFDKKKEAQTTSEVQTNLDITINVTRNAFLRGRGLEAELRGSLRVTGTTKKPRYSGELKTVRGAFEVFGKRFVIDGGELTFVNNVFSIIASGSYQRAGQQIFARLIGTNDKLDLELSASPSLPEDQILSYLLFGKSIRDTSPLEAIQLAGAVQKLRGNESFFDPIGKARELLDVDTLRLESSDDENGDQGVTVEFGKYLNEKVYLEFERSSNASQPWKGRLQLELTPQLILESSTGGATGIEGAQLQWRRNY